MSDYTSREAAIAYIREQSEELQKAFEELGGESGIYADAYNDLAENFHRIPAADVEPVRPTGHCTGWDYKQGEYYKCSDVIGNIEKGVKELRANKAQYKQYEPENGWGTVASAVVALENLRDCIYEQAEEIPLDCLYVTW